MRVGFVLLVAAVSLVASSEFVVAAPRGLSVDSPKTSSARSLKSERNVELNDEERSSEFVVAAPRGLSVDSSKTSSARSLKSERNVELNDEEREAEARVAEEKEIDAKILVNIESDPAYAKQVFRSWLQNGQTEKDIARRLKHLGLHAKHAIVLKQYVQYLTTMEERSI
ncbi:RxLR effector protein [Phytophthora megakarya]|uniref:RxLR effector protein n=1 Tax=Phytophthora megakarya TaxID=4795 RepID=A0A225WSP1_9STRA|nr:RxLR effector protein [Phytophthora megakarya]